jgi:murein DD-endopeptidase MepM/ murein hydrolase activator NlpD
MRPVSAEFAITQPFGSLATAGVTGDMNGSQVQVLVAMYGNYQPYGHAGCDIGCPVGTPVHAIGAGTVVWADWDVNLPGDDSWGPSGYFQRWAFYKSFGGRIILLKHDDGTYSDYCHLSQINVSNGQRVNEGDVIGLSGDSSGGRDGVLGAHLHTERLVDLSYSTGNGLIYGRTDPTPYFGTNPQEDDMANVSDDQLTRLLAAADRINGVITDPAAKVLTTKDIPVIAQNVVNYEVPWYGFDGKIPASGRRTTNLTAQLGWQDTATNSLAAAAKSVAPAVTPSVDVEALAAALAPKLNASNIEAFVAAIRTQWNK